MFIGNPSDRPTATMTLARLYMDVAPALKAMAR